MNPVEALDELAEIVTTTERTRSVREAPLALTNAYVGLLLAFGYASLRCVDRARALAAGTPLPMTTDPVHHYLVAAFGERIDQAIASMPPDTPFSDALVAEHRALDRTDRYKVDRLREASRILAPAERPSAIEAWIRGGAADDALSRVPFAARANAIQALLAMAVSDGGRREKIVDNALGALASVERSSIAPLLRRTLGVIGMLAEPARASRYANAMVAAEYAGELGLVSESADLLRAVLPHAAGALDGPLAIAVPLLCRPELRRELVELLIVAQGHSNRRILTGLTMATGFAWLGDFADAQPLLDDAHRALSGQLRPEEKLDITRALANAYAPLPSDTALPAILGLASGFRIVTDAYGTNSHFALSVLRFVEALVLAVVSHARRPR